MTTSSDRPELDSTIPVDAFAVEEITRMANEMFQLVASAGTSTESASEATSVSPGAVGGLLTNPSTPGTPVPALATDSLGVEEPSLDALSEAAEFTELPTIPSDVGDLTGLLDLTLVTESATDEQALSTVPHLEGRASDESIESDVSSVTVEEVDVPHAEGLELATSEVDADDVGLALTDLSRLDQLAQQLIAELPDPELLTHAVTDRPTNTTETVEKGLGDHPFLESRFDAAVAETGIDYGPSGAEFTGQTELVDQIPGLVQALASTDAALGGAEATTQELTPNEAEGTASPTQGDDSSSHEAKGDFGADDFSPRLVPALPAKHDQFDVERIRADFPILREQVHGHRLVWLDNGATTQKPQSVIDRVSYFYEHENSNVHRTAHTLAGRSTDAYEGAREKLRRFINASSADEIVYVRGTTEGINLIANTYGEKNVCEGDEILISNLEHHANIVPWQMLCARKGAKLRVAPVDDSGQIILSEYERLINPRTKLISFTQVSNALGTITPAAEMIEIAHRNGVPVVLDGAQGVLHMRVDVQSLGADFYVFSGHKMFAPTGIGVVYGKLELLNDMPPWQGGGNMIDQVYFDHTTYQDPPWRFEAGTGNIADAVGLGAAVDYINEIGMENIAAHEHEMLAYGTEGLLSVPGLRIIGTAENKAAVMSFVLDGHAPQEVGAYLDRQGIAVRAGHHCAQPILRRFGLTETVRPSLALYNTTEDIDLLVDALKRLQSGRDR